VDEMIRSINTNVISELASKYGNEKNYTNLCRFMEFLYRELGNPFIILIDEWDCVFREHKQDKLSQEKYLKYLKLLLKDQEYVALAYMTGILPIKKYGTHSALNMFFEYTMVDPMRL
jgi:hypothetical protein